MKDEKFPIEIVNKIDDEYINIVKSILTNPEFLKRKFYHHHEHRSVYGHCLIVSIRSYCIAKSLNLDYKAAAIAGLLHDFYTTDWQLPHPARPIWKAHGFVHGKQSAMNASLLFPELMNKKIKNSIQRHMFPLTVIPPLYLEGWIISIVDKTSSIHDLTLSKGLLKYIGIRKKGDMSE